MCLNKIKSFLYRIALKVDGKFPRVEQFIARHFTVRFANFDKLKLLLDRLAYIESKGLSTQAEIDAMRIIITEKLITMPEYKTFNLS